MITYETRIGTVNLSKNYFSKLIGNAVSSCYGVKGMIPNNKQRLLDIFMPSNSIDKGVSVKGDINNVIIDSRIIVSDGMNMNAISKSITHKIKYTVFETTGINVKKVTVHVDGIEE